MCVCPLYCKMVKYVDAIGEVKYQRKFYVSKEHWQKDKDLSIDKDLFYTLPCGKCPDCLINYSKEWSVRIMNEASYYKDNCFITLTYANAPEYVSKRDFQLFMKRLRKKVGKVRFFACGEYGAKRKRPHYHCIIFGWKPEDLEYFFTDKSGEPIYKSKIVSSLWNAGFVTVGEVTQRTSLYCAKYLQKLQSDARYVPFTLMSLKPGIGYKFADSLTQKQFDNDKIYINAKMYKLPRYYLKIAEKKGFNLKINKNNRKIKSSLIREELINDKIKLYREKFNFTKNF